MRALAAAKLGASVVYATDMGTTYRTADAGRTWEQVYSTDHPNGAATTRGLDVTTTYGVHFDPDCGALRAAARSRRLPDSARLRP